MATEDYSGAARDQRRQNIILLVLLLLSVVTLGLLIVGELRADAPYAQYQRKLADLEGRSSQIRVHQIATAQKIDRCPTCHLAIARKPLTQQVSHPLRAHPKDLLRSHPLGRFSCTDCHGAGGELVDRCLPARGDVDGRALDAKMVQASCGWCHDPAEHLPGGALLTAGLAAYRRLGCGGCHRAKNVDAGPRVGPPLDGVGAKLDRDQVRSFLADPQGLRPGTAMPSFFRAGAPDFIQALRDRSKAQQLDALVAWLFSSRAPQSGSTAPGSWKAGQRHFVKLGCVACHRAEPSHRLGTIGPDLGRARQRLKSGWLQRWLSSPKAVNPQTRMPDFRLGHKIRADLVAYLSAKNRAETHATPNRKLVLQGQQLARKLGCPGCHAIKGLENVPPVGPDLDGFGDKPAALLDWGHAAATSRTAPAWTEIKLKQPLAFDRRPGVLLMPWQQMRPGELDSLEVLMRSLVETDSVPPGKSAQPSLRARRLRRGETVIDALGCRQCHRVGGRGDRLKQLLPRPSDRPPSLDGEGSKVLPAWLNGFLLRPSALRPWLDLRMPTFNLTERQTEILAAHFASRDGASYPFVKQSAPAFAGSRLKESLELFDKLQCIRCHLLSNAPRLKPGELSPDLSLSGGRLRREWIRRFILEPQTLMPGTRMPTLFPLQDEDNLKGPRNTPAPDLFGGDVERQVRALTDLSLWWGSAAAARASERGRRR